MKSPTREEQRNVVRQWEATGRELERIRRDALRGMAYNWADVDALLEMGDRYDGPPRVTSGLIEMLRWFRIGARRGGLLKPDVRMQHGGEHRLERDCGREDQSVRARLSRCTRSFRMRD